MLSNDRKQWLDFARMIAIINVVLCHAIQNVYSLSLDGVQQISSISRVFLFSSFSVGRLGVPFFLMLSGYLLIDRQYDRMSTLLFWKKRWLHILICTWIWFAVYEVFSVSVLGKPIDVIKTLEDMLFINHTGMMNAWYMPMILGVYILIPFVGIVFQSIDIRLLKFPVILFSAVVFIYPILCVINNVYRAEVPLSLQFSYGFCGGAYGLILTFGYLVKKDVFKFIKSQILIVVAILSYVVVVIFQLWSYANGIEYSLWYDNAFILISSLCLFELFSRIKTCYCYRFVRMMAYYSFPIYLIHIIFCYSLSPYINQLMISHPEKVFLVWIISIFVSIICAYLINRIPKVGKYILYTK